MLGLTLEGFSIPWDNIICLISIWQLMILLFLRHAMEVSDSEDDDYVSAFFSVSRVHCFNVEWATIFDGFPFSIIFDVAQFVHVVFNHTVQIFLLRAAGFLLPCYIMACAISILQRRQRRLVDITSHIR